MSIPTNMDVIRNTGAGAALNVRLLEGQSVKAEPDALVTMSQGVELGAKLDGGLIGGLMRSMFAGESLFCQTLTATHGVGEVVLCASELGDIEVIDVSEREPLHLIKGAYLASDESIDVSTGVQRGAARALLSGAGLFVLSASGRGRLAISSYGSILRFTLAPGEVRAVDNGHLLAWSAGMHYEMRLAVSSRRGLLRSATSSMASGEGLMCFFEGPGSVWLQTHKPPPPPAAGSAGQGA